MALYDALFSCLQFCINSSVNTFPGNHSRNWHSLRTLKDCGCIFFAVPSHPQNKKWTVVNLCLNRLWNSTSLRCCCIHIFMDSFSLNEQTQYCLQIVQEKCAVCPIHLHFYCRIFVEKKFRHTDCFLLSSCNIRSRDTWPFKK